MARIEREWRFRESTAESDSEGELIKRLQSVFFFPSSSSCEFCDLACRLFSSLRKESSFLQPAAERSLLTDVFPRQQSQTITERPCLFYLPSVVKFCTFISPRSSLLSFLCPPLTAAKTGPSSSPPPQAAPPRPPPAPPAASLQSPCPTSPSVPS